MKFKKHRDEEERLERAAKIQAHLNKGKAEPKANPKADDKVEPTATQPTPRIYPPLQPWEKLNRWGRREQFRPMTSRELEQENDRIFMESIRKQEEAHAKKVAAFEQEQAVEERAAKRRAEHEARTRMRPYDPGRYCSVEEAIRRGYVGNEPSQNKERGDDWSSAHNPEGLMGGGR